VQDLPPAPPPRRRPCSPGPRPCGANGEIDVVESGRAEIRAALEELAATGVALRKLRALDFGFVYSVLVLQVPTTVAIAARVRNESTATWACARADPHRPVRLGNHWLAEDGTQMLRLDDGRGDLPEDLAGGAEVELELRIRTPFRRIGPAGHMEIHAIPRDRVRELAAAAGSHPSASGLPSSER
jgi:hypothetical protein